MAFSCVEKYPCNIYMYVHDNGTQEERRRNAGGNEEEAKKNFAKKVVKKFGR